MGKSLVSSSQALLKACWHKIFPSSCQSFSFITASSESTEAGVIAVAHGVFMATTVESLIVI